MNFSKVKYSAIATAIAIASPLSQAEIELGNGISVTGFIDMSFVYLDDDSVDSTGRNFNVDQVETSFLYAGSDGITAQVDIEYGESGGCDSGSTTCGAGPDDDETFVEQAFITKQINDQFSVTAGRFLSYTGFETEEPTGLFQYSGTGYAANFYGGYQNGVSGKFVANDALAITLSVINDLGNPSVSDNTQLGTELGFHVTPAEGVTAKAFYSTEADTDLVNLWGSYSTGAMTFGLEYNMADYADDSEATGYLALFNYAPNDFGLTIRYHAWEVEDAAGVTTNETDGFTIAPTYACSDNLLLVLEYRTDSLDVGTSGLGTTDDASQFALEALFTF